MVQKKSKAFIHKIRFQGIERSAADHWREQCPVQSEHKSIFPGDEWLWQPGAAAWVWGVVKAAGGKISAEELTQNLAELRGLSHRQAHGLRNRGLTVLEMFDLIAIERVPLIRVGYTAVTYGGVKIIRNAINEKLVRKKKMQAEMRRCHKILYETLTSLRDK
jgi:hypothetical protein